MPHPRRGPPAADPIAGALIRAALVPDPDRVTVSNVAGSVTITTCNRREVALQEAERVRLSTVSGSITVRGSLGEHGSMNLESVSGRLKVATPTTNLRYEPSSYNGRVSACFGGDSQWINARGCRRLEGVRGTGAVLVVAKTHSGSAELCDRWLFITARAHIR